MSRKLLGAAAAAVSMLAIAAPAKADDATPSPAFVQSIKDAVGIDFNGYFRGGFFPTSSGVQAGQYQLGGDLQHYRLGNEGDQYWELGLSKTIDTGNGTKVQMYWMPNNYNGTNGTAQAYAGISGLEFAPEASFWAGQRYHRIQDIHIVDKFLFEDGENYGVGMDGLKIGAAKLNVSLLTSGSFGNNNANTNNADRISLQLVDIPTNQDGKLVLTASAVNGTFLEGSGGGALGLLHNQSNFLVAGLTNSFFLQTSNGHTAINGEFYNLDTSTTTLMAPALPGPVVSTTVTTPGIAATQSRIADSINWQSGAFGGQALIGYQTLTPDGGAKVADSSVGGRISYGVAKNVKLLSELSLTSRAIDGAATQNLNKETFAVAFAPNTDYWSRPEFRVYWTHANWNDAAAAANATSFGANGTTNASILGFQLEAWW